MRLHPSRSTAFLLFWVFFFTSSQNQFYQEEIHENGSRPLSVPSGSYFLVSVATPAGSLEQKNKSDSDVCMKPRFLSNSLRSIPTSLVCQSTQGSGWQPLHDVTKGKP